MSKFTDITNGDIRNLFKNRNLLPAGKMTLAKATTTSKIKSTNGTSVVIGGIVSDISAIADNTTIATIAAIQTVLTGQAAYYVQPDLQTVFYVIVTNAAGTINVLQGTYAGQAFTAFSTAKGDGSIPDVLKAAEQAGVADTYVPLGYVKVVTNGTTYTPVTDNFDKANVTSTFFEVTTL